MPREDLPRRCAVSMTCAAVDVRHAMSRSSDESVLCAMLLAEACDAIVIDGRRTGELDGRRDEESIRWMAALKRVQLAAAGKRPYGLMPRL